MALFYSHGAIQWLAADAVSTTYAQTCTDVTSGATFQPKALRFTWAGNQSATDLLSTTVNQNRGVGFAVSTSSRRCVGSYSLDAFASGSDCGTMARDDSIACTTDGTGAADGMLDLSSIDAGGFTPIVDNQPTNNITVFWEAWGGTDITNATIVDISEPAGTGDVDYTATGFLPGAEDQVVMLAGSQDSSALNTGLAEASGFMIGYVTGPGRRQCVVSGNSDDASATTDCDGTGLNGECINMIIRAGAATVQCRASFTQFNADGFRLNWAAVGITGRKYIALAIKGGSWLAGVCVGQVNAINDTTKVSGMRFKPVGISLIATGDAETASNVAIAPDAIMWGCGSSASSRRSLATIDRSGQTTSAVTLTLQYDQILSQILVTGTLDGLLDISSMDKDGFTLICDAAATTATKAWWVGFLAFGDVGDYSGSQRARAKDQPMIRGPM